MDGGGMSVAGVASAAITAGIGVNAAASPTSQNVAPASLAAGTAVAAGAMDFVVSISDTAMQALALDAANAATGTPSSQLTDDLAALALLAILERDQRQQDPLVNAALAISAYLAMQTLTGG